MNSFSLNRDKMRLIPYIQAALVVKPTIKFWGSPWTPPPWMKDNNAFDRGNMKNDAQTLQAFALYLAKYVEEYGKEGIKVSAVHPQNEPGYQQDYPSCGWTGSQMATFIKTYMGPTFTQRGVTAQIWMGTLSNDSVDPGIAQAVMADAGAKTYVKGFGMQWATNGRVGSFISMYGLPVWQSEHKCGNYPWEGGYNATRAPNDHAYGEESWGYLKDWIGRGVTAYSAWNMVLDTVGKNLDMVPARGTRTHCWPSTSGRSGRTSRRPITSSATCRSSSTWARSGSAAAAASTTRWCGRTPTTASSPSCTTA